MTAPAGHVGNQLEHLGGSDAIELGAKLKRAQRIEIGVALNLSLRDGKERVKESIGNAWRAQKAVRDLERLGKGVAQREEALLRRILRHPFARQLGASCVLGESR